MEDGKGSKRQFVCGWWENGCGSCLLTFRADETKDHNEYDQACLTIFYLQTRTRATYLLNTQYLPIFDHIEVISACSTVIMFTKPSMNKPDGFSQHDATCQHRSDNSSSPPASYLLNPPKNHTGPHSFMNLKWGNSAVCSKSSPL